MVRGGGRKGGDEGTRPVSAQDVSSEERVKQIQEHMEEYVNLVRTRAPAEDVKKAEEQLAREMGRDTFQAFKRQLPAQLRVRRGIDATRVYQHFRLPGRKRIVHDRRGEAGRERHAAEREGRRTESMVMREGRLTHEKAKHYENYLGERMQAARSMGEAAGIKKTMDELLSRFEQMIIKRFEGDQKIVQMAEEGRQTFLKKTAQQWSDFFSRFAGRFLGKRVPVRNIQQFLFRGMVPKGAKGIVISDMTLKSGRVERFIRFSILAEAMAKLAKAMPGQMFGKDVLTGEELYYLALAAARGREYVTGPKPTEGRFMGGVAEERASQELGIPLAAHLAKKTKELRAKSRRGWGVGREREPLEEGVPGQFIPWWHWGNLKPGGPHRSTTVAFYIGLGIVIVIGLLALTAQLLK